MRVSFAIAAAAATASVVVTPAGGLAELAASPARYWVSDGTIHAIAATPRSVYLGGEFNLLGPYTGSWVELAPSGVVGRAWPVVDGDVELAVSDGSGGWYIAGDFRGVGGVARAGLARLRGNRTVDRNWKPPAGTGSISALALRGNALIVGGEFAKIAGKLRHGFAALDARTGGLLPLRLGLRGSTSALGTVAGSPLLYVAGNFSRTGKKTRSMLLAFDPRRGKIAWRLPTSGSITTLTASSRRVLYAAGSFSAIGKEKREGVAAIDLTRHRATSWAPQIDGYVAVAVPSPNGQVVYLAGEFAAVGGRSRRGLAAVSARTGSVTPWDPNIGGTVAAIVPSANGAVVYFGGEFESVGDVERSNLAAVDAQAASPTAWDPATNAEVSVLVRSTGGALLAGGAFETAAAKRRNGLAAITPDGAAVEEWVPPVRGIVRALTRSPDGSRVYVGGRFVFGSERVERSLATIDVGTGAIEPFSDPMNAAVWTIASGDGSTVYVGGGFTTVKGQRRTRLAALTPTGDLTSWNSGANALVRTILTVGDVIYVGGAFGSIGGSSRRGLAEVDDVTGRATGWDAQAEDDVNTLALVGETLYVGGDFASIGRRSRRYLAALNRGDGSATTWDPSPDEAVRALRVVPDGTRLVAVGDFTNIGRIAREAAEFELPSGRLTAWRPSAPLYATALDFGLGGNTLYLGGEGGVLVFR